MAKFANTLRWKNDPDTPKEIFNWRLWYGVLVFGILGIARGLDEGLTGTTTSLASFDKLFHIDPNAQSHSAGRLGNIVAMLQLGSIPGALFAFYITDKIGRLWALRGLCVLWIIGIAIYLASAATGSVSMVYAGRFIAGMGVGQTTVVGPIYLAEISPRSVRGLCVCVFASSAYLGIMLGYFAAWGSSLHISNESQLQWVVPNLLHIYFAVIVLVLSFGAVESPRWLKKTGKHEQAVYSLSRIRSLPEHHPYIMSEVNAIDDQLLREKTDSKRVIFALKEIARFPANRYRLMITIMAQLLSQWSGANSIVVYAPQFFAILGTSGQNEKLLATAITGVVDFCAAVLCAVFIVDLLGRKRALLSGITLQLLGLLYIGSFLATDPGVTQGTPQSSGQKHAATGAIAMIYIAGVGWAVGWNSLQYLINSEIWPLQLRAVGSSIAMTLHFTNQYGSSKAVPLMFNVLSTYGTFFFFSAVTVIGLVWAWLFLPELAGKSLESVDRVFALPWWQIGRRGRYIVEEEDEDSK